MSKAASHPKLRILISAGPTREFFDTVRFISNPSSGKMGYALAAVARQRGHEVTLVTGPVALQSPKDVEVISVVTAEQMARACKKAFRRANVAIMTAAVCDFRPADRLERKLAKQAKPRRVILEPTEDIAAALGRIKGKRLLVGFAMEDHDARIHAEGKLKRKNCDLIVLNGPGNVAADRAEVELFTPEGGWVSPFSGSKRKVANLLVRIIEEMWEARFG
jgi:phosphopantothenoylcysteine decarboxylase/phosphopantothenate--cysteine ligase